MVFLKRYHGLFIILFLSFWAIKPLVISGFFSMHDDTQVARVFEMGKMLKMGVFPVRWVPDLGYGYGYPIFNFYAPLAYYTGGFFMLLGFDALVATKLMMILGILLSGIFMYFLAREFFGEWGGVIAGLFYLYAPYHALDIFVRGDVAEFWAYAFIPLVFLGFYKIQKFGILGGFGFAGVILSHNLTAFMVTPFLLIAIFMLVVFSKKDKVLIAYHLSLIAFLGLALSAFYWIPALLEMHTTNILSQIGGGADFRDHFVCFGQLWSSHWGFGGSAKGCIDGMSFMIGKLHIVAAVTALILTLLTKNKNYNGYKRYIIFLVFAGFIFSIFFTLPISKPIWEGISLMAFFQYPWRFLLFASFFSSLLAGSLVYLFKQFNINPYYTGIVLAVLLLIFNIKFFSPQTTFFATAKDFTNELALKWTASKTSDEYLPSDFKKPDSEREIAKTPIPFEETSIEKVSNIISLIGVLALIVGIILLR